MQSWPTTKYPVPKTARCRVPLSTSIKAAAQAPPRPHRAYGLGGRPTATRRAFDTPGQVNHRSTRRAVHPPRLRHDECMKGQWDTGRFAEVGDLNHVGSRLEAAEVVRRMLEDLLAHPDEWENATLDRFLDALAASLESIPGVYGHRGEQFPDEPTWKIFAEALVVNGQWLRVTELKYAAAPLPVLTRCASCAPGRLAPDYVPVLAAGSSEVSATAGDRVKRKRRPSYCS